MHYNHSHRATAQLQLNICYIITYLALPQNVCAFERVCDGRSMGFLRFRLFFFQTELLKRVFLFQNCGQALTCHHKSVCSALCHSGILHQHCSGQSIRKRQSVSIGFA